MLASHPLLQTASNAFREWLHAIEKWTAKWNVAIHSSKSACVTFSLRPGTCTGLTFDGNPIINVTSHCYLGVHLDRRLTWSSHITAVKFKSLVKLKNLDWLFHSSKLQMSSKALLIKAILSPTWNYAIQVRGTAAKSQLNRLSVVQSRAARHASGLPWYVTNKAIERDLKVTPLGDQSNFHSSRYADRLMVHPNRLANILANPISLRRLKRVHPIDLPTRRIVLYITH